MHDSKVTYVQSMKRLRITIRMCQAEYFLCTPNKEHIWGLKKNLVVLFRRCSKLSMIHSIYSTWHRSFYRFRIEIIPIIVCLSFHPPPQKKNSEKESSKCMVQNLLFCPMWSSESNFLIKLQTQNLVLF
jgi:hypothetical protein